MPEEKNKMTRRRTSWISFGAAANNMKENNGDYHHQFVMDWQAGNVTLYNHHFCHQDSKCNLPSASASSFWSICYLSIDFSFEGDCGGSYGGWNNNSEMITSDRFKARILLVFTVVSNNSEIFKTAAGRSYCILKTAILLRTCSCWKSSVWT